MRPEMHDLCISSYVVISKCNPLWGIVGGEQYRRVRLTYRDDSGRVYEIASGPDTEEGRRWLEEVARAVRMQ